MAMSNREITGKDSRGIIIMNTIMNRKPAIEEIQKENTRGAREMIEEIRAEIERETGIEITRAGLKRIILGILKGRMEITRKNTVGGDRNQTVEEEVTTTQDQIQMIQADQVPHTEGAGTEKQRKRKEALTMDPITQITNNKIMNKSIQNINKMSELVCIINFNQNVIINSL